MNAGEPVFVDSNVLLYSADRAGSAKRERAREWLEHLWIAGTGRLSWQVLHEFYWNAARKMGVPPDGARELVEDFSRWRPVETTLGLVQQAWIWSDQAQMTYWDALIVAAAERSGARYLLSEDFRAGRWYGEVRIVNPFDEAPPGEAPNRR